MSVIRSVRPTDAAWLFSFLARSHPLELTAQIWPDVPPERARLSIVQLLAQPLINPAFPRGAWLALDHGRVAGLAIARARAGGLVWDVERLLALPGAPDAAAELLDHLAGRATRAFARRVFLDAPRDGLVPSIAQRAGFGRYTSARLYVLRPPLPMKPAQALEGRQRVPADEHPLFKMYCAAVPLSVRTAEAMTCDEWAAMYRGPNRWAAAIFGAQDQYVWEDDGRIAGWMELSSGRRSQHLSLLLHPSHEHLADTLLCFALSQVNRRAAVYATVREYQSGLITALERLGFQLVGESDAYVRHLAPRVPEARLMPAKIAGRC